MANKPTEYTHQTFKNLSADTSVSPPIPREGIMGKASDGSYYTVAVNSDGSLAEPLPTAGNNASLTVTEVTVGDVTTTTLEKVIDSVTYTKTVVENSATGVTTVSAWS